LRRAIPYRGMTTWQREDRPCPICGGTRRHVIGERGGEAHWAGLGVATAIVRCLECDCYYQSPTLIPDSNPYTQTADAYFEHHTRETGRNAGKYIAERAESFLGRKGTILDIGCGRGDLLIGARDSGWKVQGLEMTPAFADVAEQSGIPVQRTKVELATLDAADVIVFSGVLEHLYDPMAALRAAHKALTPGGLVVIDVPNESSLVLRAGNAAMRLKGWSVNLSPTFAPYHVVGFTPKGLRRALERSRFEVAELTLYRWATHCAAGRPIARLGSALASWVGARVGMAEGLYAWARRT